MFINFTNHSSKKWSEEQKNAAIVLGGNIIDITFPNISPYLNAQQIYELAKEYAQRISKEYSGAIVHIMGEMTFVYAFVNLYYPHRCVASTTERKTTNVEDKKTSIFKFAQFRDYIK